MVSIEALLSGYFGKDPDAKCVDTMSGTAPASSVPAPPRAPIEARVQFSSTEELIETSEDACAESTTVDVKTMARMMMQGLVRVLQDRQKEGKGPLPFASLEDEFKAKWRVPFLCRVVAVCDAIAFSHMRPDKFMLTGRGAAMVVSLRR